MASNWDYRVTHYDSTDNWASKDITADVIAIPTFTSAGTGEMNSAKLILSADEGHFIRVTGAVHPKIRQFDRIRIVVTDGVTSFAYNRVFDVIKLTPIKTKSQGTRLQLILIGLEHWLDKVNYAKTSYFDNAFDVFVDIAQSYNAHRGSLMPELILYNNTSNNQLPNYTSNIYDYGLNEDTCYVRMNDLVDKLGASADAGGILNFFELGFVSNDANVTTFAPVVRPSGFTTTSPLVVIEDSANVNVGESEGGIEAITGTVINAWGANDQGSLPVNFSRYKSRQQRFPKTGGNLFPLYQAGVTYLAGSIVQKAGTVYKANADTNTPPPSIPPLTFWSELTPGEYYGNTITYSPWTDEAVDCWANSGSHPSGGTYVLEGKAMWDANVIIRDNVKGDPPVFSTWADLQANSDNYNVKWKYDNRADAIYRGTRCLIIGNGGGAFVGNDKTGKPFANSVAEFDGEDWIVKYTPVTNMLCAVLDQSRLYQFVFGAWVNNTTTPNGSHCFHYYDAIESAISASLNNDTDEEWTLTNDGSAVKVTYSWFPALVTTDEALGQMGASPGDYSAGAWLNFRFPFPPNSFTNINTPTSHDIGELYGGAYKVGSVPDSNMEPATLDIQNMHLSHDGFRGFNAGASSEDLGQISSIDFMMKLLYTASTIVNNFAEIAANFKMRCYVMDIDDNVVFQDFIIYFNDEYQAVSLPISQFQIYRGRQPRTLQFFVDSIVFPKGLDAQEIFEWRHVKQICFQTQESYDEQGRYAPSAVGKYSGVIWESLTGTQLQIEMSIDAFRFTKPLLVNTGQVTIRDLEPTFLQKQEIGNYDQLQSDAFAELQKTQFQRVQYDVTTTGRFDIGFGNSFFLKDNEIVTEFAPAQTGETPTQIKLVAKHIDYSITKPVEGKGGFLRTLLGVRRFI